MSVSVSCELIIAHFAQSVKRLTETLRKVFSNVLLFYCFYVMIKQR